MLTSVVRPEHKYGNDRELFFHLLPKSSNKEKNLTLHGSLRWGRGVGNLFLVDTSLVDNTARVTSTHIEKGTGARLTHAVWNALLLGSLISKSRQGAASKTTASCKTIQHATLTDVVRALFQGEAWADDVEGIVS